MSSTDSTPSIERDASIESTPGIPLILGVALFASAVWLVVWKGSLDGVFHFDDYGNIVDNERIRSLWPLTTFFSNNRPVGLYSFALNWHFSQNDEFAYHVVNLAIHVVNGLLLFSAVLLATLLFRKHWQAVSSPSLRNSDLVLGAFISTAWVIHPLTTQAVTNIVQRYESLASLGYLGVWVGMLLYLQGWRALGCIAIGLSAWIGLLSKEIFATAPLSVLLFDRLLTRDKWLDVFKLRWLAYLVMGLPFLWFIPMVSRFFDPVKTAGGAMGFGMKGPSSWDYLRTQPEIIWHYIRLVFWPLDLCFDYVWRVQSNPWIYLSLGGVIVAIISAALFGYSRSIATTKSSATPPTEAATSDDSRFAIGLASWMTLTFYFVLAPTSSIVPIRDLAFEHRMYLPSALVVAGVILVSWSLMRRMLESSNQPNVLRLGVATIAIALLLMLGFRTHLRNLDYQSGQSLWQSAVEASPKNPRAWYSLGQVLYKRGDKDEALEPMIKAVGYSNEPVAIYDAGLAGCLLHIGRLDDAIKLYKRAIENKPDYDQAFNDLGVIYLKKGELEEARSYFTEASELGNAEAFYNLGWIDRKQGAFDDAERHFRKALAEQPNLGSAARQVAWLTATKPSVTDQELVSAKGLLEKHYDLTITKSSGALDTAAVIAAGQGKFDAAVEYSKQALAAAQASDQPDEDWVAELKERLVCYESGKTWLRSSSQ